MRLCADSRGDGGGTKSSGSSTSSTAVNSNRRYEDGFAAPYDGEVVPFLVCIVVLTEQLMKCPGVHERQPAQVKDAMTHASRGRCQAVKHLGNLQDQGDVHSPRSSTNAVRR